MAKTIKIGGELESMATGKVVAAASAIKDKTQNKYQDTINADVARHENEIHGTGGIDSRLTDVEQMEQIVIDGGEAQIAQGADFTNPDAPKRAKIPTVGAIVDGLNDGVYDVSKRNPTAGPNSDGKFTLDYILSNANTLIPTGWRHGGMIISFVQSSDNKYVQKRLMHPLDNASTAAADFMNEANWQGIDNTPILGSNNIVESGGVAKPLDELKNKTNDIERKIIGTQKETIEIYTDGDSLIGTINSEGADFVGLKKHGEQVLVPSSLKTINEQNINGNGNISIREISTDLIEEKNIIEDEDAIIIGTDKERVTVKIEDRNTEVKGDIKIIKDEQTILETESSLEESAPIIIGDTKEEPTVKISNKHIEFFGQVDINGSPINNDICIGAAQPILLGITKYQKPTKDINMFGIYGQSLSTGQQTCPELSRVNYRGNVMIGDREWAANQYNVAVGSSLSPLKARANNSQGNNYIPTGTNDQTCGETCGVNACNAMKRLFDDYILESIDRKFLDASFGIGGISIELLSKNCPNNSGERYSALETAIDIIKAAASNENKSICCTAMLWMQGEWNESSHEDMGWFDGEPSTHNKDDYKAYLIGGTTTGGVTVNGMVNDLIATMMTKFNQELPPIVLGNQMSEHWILYRSLPIIMAQLEASHETDKYIICSPTYRVTDRNGHLDANGSRWLAEFYAKVWYKVVILGQEWKPLQPICIKRNGKNLEIEFHVPCPPLVFDTKQVRSVANKGFSIWLNNAAVTINNVSIFNNSVIIETNTDLMIGDLEVSYAGVGVRFGNLRDSDPWRAFEVYKDLDTIVDNPSGVSYRPSFEPKDDDNNVIYNKPYPCQNFCVNFYYMLESELNVLNINI